VTFTFEKGAAKHGGGDGWADVWKKDFFGWEYKGKKKNLDAAYDQLLEYRADLENPKLLVVCDMDIIRVHTNYNSRSGLGMADEFAKIKEMLLGGGAFRQVNLAPLGDKILGGHGSVAKSASFSQIGMADEFAREIRQRQFCVHTLHESKNFPCGCRRDRLCRGSGSSSPSPFCCCRRWTATAQLWFPVSARLWLLVFNCIDRRYNICQPGACPEPHARLLAVRRTAKS
jgi:hypothetical protein